MKVSKNYIGFILFTFVLLTNSYAQANNTSLQRKILIASKDIRIDSLLQLFKRQTGLEFSFNTNKISPSTRIDVTKKEQSVSHWLTHLQSTFGIQYKITGNHIILIDRDKKTVIPKQPAKSKIAVSRTKVTPPKKIAVELKADTATQQTQNISNIPTIAEPAIAIDSVKIFNDSLQNDSNARGQIVSTENNAGLNDERKKPGDGTVKSDTVARANVTSNSIAATIPDVAGKPGEEKVQAIFGYSKHGSGDMKGIVFGSEYMKRVSGKFSLGISLRGSVNSDKHTFIVDNQTTGQRIDASIRFTTAGVQLGPIAHLHLSRSTKSDFYLGMGIFGRYQSASNGSDGYSLYNPLTTGVPTILIGYQNSTPQHTVSLGGLIQLGYDYRFNGGLCIGIVAGFQTDTNGDALPQAGLVFGKKFFK